MSVHTLHHAARSVVLRCIVCALAVVVGGALAAGTPLSRTQAAWPDATALPLPGMDLALQGLVAGLSQRERALDLAARLEALDFEELAAWERLLPAVPLAALSPRAREQEAAMRLVALPLLAARQQDYRRIERDLVASLSAQAPDPSSLGARMARLAAVREWSELADQAQRQTRASLDMAHTRTLARAVKLGAALDASALGALARLRERRLEFDAALAAAVAAWAAARDEVRREVARQDLSLAAAIVKTMTDNERRAFSLRQRAAADASPSPRRDLWLATAGVLQATAKVGSRAAAEQVGAIDWQGDAFLAEPARIDSADPELTSLAIERRGLARSLRQSVALRLSTLGALRTLAGQRQRVLAGATYLAAPDGQRRAQAALEQAAGLAWRQADEWRVAAGDIAGAEAGERAVAVERLAMALESLVLLEDQLHTLAIGQLLDPAPRPADPRAAAGAWRRDVDALQAIDAQWTQWRMAWDRQGQREEADLAALRGVLNRIHALWTSRLASLVRAWPPGAAGDDIGRLTAGMVGRVDARARALVADHARLRQWLPEAAADPLVGAAHRSSAALRWSLASAGLRELPQYFQEVAALRLAAPQLDMALNAARPAVQRLAATMWLSGALARKFHE